MNRSVIVYGPQGSGKSLHAEKLRQHFGMERIIENWNGSDPFPRDGALVLTNNPHPQIVARGNYYVLNKALLLAAGAVCA
ncbi:hypothetical protein H7691_06545 [Stenotrophomonas sp. CW117]|uniref:hypothetical protein n=1 Tax=Stenotrophomonas TaxID=40323 RepID=UPI0017801E3A|nr:hypothetical protein [Stenotrophomonas sp. CW117]QOF99768.1 hypothetical protein H7691_06545 [Stenotrophomonas sp. CW117]